MNIITITLVIVLDTYQSPLVTPRGPRGLSDYKISQRWIFQMVRGGACHLGQVPKYSGGLF